MHHFRKKQRNSLFRPAVVGLSVMAMLASSVSLIADTWAFFSDEHKNSTDTVYAASFRMDVSVLRDGMDSIQVAADEDGVQTVTLQAGYAYNVCLSPAPENTASKGYTLISTDEAEAYTDNVLVDQGYQFTIDLTQKTDTQPAENPEPPETDPETTNPGNPDEGNPDEGNPDEGNPDENPDEGNPDDENPDEGNTDEGNTDEGNPDEGNPDEGNTDEGNTDSGNTDEGNADNGNTDSENTDEGNPDEGNPDEGNPDEGNPDEGNADNGNTDEGNTDEGSTDTDNTGEVSAESVVYEAGEALEVMFTSLEADSQEESSQLSGEEPGDNSTGDARDEAADEPFREPEQTPAAPKVTPPAEITFTFTPVWGTYIPDAETFSFFNFPCVENGSTVNQFCEPIEGVHDWRENIIYGDVSFGDSIDVVDTQEAEIDDGIPKLGDPDYVGPGHNILNYYQTDYSKTPYGAGTIESSGCGITSLAMVATYMTGHTYTPDQLARWFGGRAENNIARMELGATTLGLPWEKAENIDIATQALKDGKIVIMLLEGISADSPFTDSQHFLVVRGVIEGEKPEDIRYLVNDPFEPNYEKWDLKDGFANGFRKDAFLRGYSGSWVFDPDAIPEEFVPYEKEEIPPQDNYPGISLTHEQQELIACLIWAEARGESLEGQQAVAEVILNRLISGQFGDSLEGVILGEGSFQGASQIAKAEPWQAQFDALNAARFGQQVLERDVFYFGTRARNNNIFKQIGGHIFCRSKTAK